MFHTTLTAECRGSTRWIAHGYILITEAIRKSRNNDINY